MRNSNEKHPAIEITYKTEHAMSTWSSEYFDASLEDIFNGIFGMLVAQTWDPQSILEEMRDFAIEHLPAEYETEEKEC